VKLKGHPRESGLTELNELHLHACSLVTDVGMLELRDLSALDTLWLSFFTHVTDVGLQHLTSLTVLTDIDVNETSTTQAGRTALKAALPALVFYSP
jgi:hypothetical protein